MIYPFCGCLVADHDKTILHFIGAAGVGSVLPVLVLDFGIFISLPGVLNSLEMWHVDVLATNAMDGTQRYCNIKIFLVRFVASEDHDLVLLLHN